MTNQLAQLPARTASAVEFSDGITRPAGTLVQVSQWAVESRQDYVTVTVDGGATALVSLFSITPA